MSGEVFIEEGESFEEALERFREKCKRAGILSDLSKHRHFQRRAARKENKRRERLLN